MRSECPHDQLGNRHRKITNQRRVNEVTEVDDASDAVTGSQGVLCIDVVVNDLRALFLKLGKHFRVEVIENLLDDAAAAGFFDVVCVRAKTRGLSEIPEELVPGGRMKETAQSAGQARGHGANIAQKRRV